MVALTRAKHACTACKGTHVLHVRRVKKGSATTPPQGGVSTLGSKCDKQWGPRVRARTARMWLRRRPWQHVWGSKAACGSGRAPRWCTCERRTAIGAGWARMTPVSCRGCSSDKQVSKSLGVLEQQCYSTWTQGSTSVTQVSQRTGVKYQQCYTSVTTPGREGAAVLHKCHITWA